MAKSLDELVEFLLEEIALAGDQGVAIKDLAEYATKFFAEPNQDDATTSPPTNPARFVVDRNFVRKIWQWLTREQDVLIVEDEHLKDLTFDDLEIRFPKVLDGIPDAVREAPAPAPEASVPSNALNVLSSTGSHVAADSPRISVTRDRIYYAICGHGPDPTRVFPKEYELLCAIARTRQEGILQGPLGKLTGQNKHSVPRRTDNLHSKGYIVKRTVLAGGQKTCRLTLRRFAESSLNNIAVQSSTISLRDVALQIFSALKASAFTTQDDLAQILSMKGQAQRRVLGQVITQLVRQKCLKKVKAALGPGSTAGDLKVCIQIIREPVDTDWQTHEGAVVDFSVPVQHAVAVARRDIDDLGNELPEIDGDLESTTIDKSIESLFLPNRPQWNPDRNLPNVLQNFASNTGDVGITNTMARRAITGLTVRRPIESALVRLSHSSMNTQPLETRNLSLVRSTEARNAVSQFIHRTATSFHSMVQKGQTQWSAVNVGKTVAKELEDASRDDLTKSAERDEFGFIKRVSPKGQAQYGSIELEDIVRSTAAASLAIRSHEAILVEHDSGKLELSTMVGDHRTKASPAIQTTRNKSASLQPKKTKTVVYTGNGRPRKFMHGTEKFWRDIMLAKKMQIDSTQPTRVNRRGATNDEESVRWYNARPTGFDILILKVLEQNLPLPKPMDVSQPWADKMAAFLSRKRPGLYVTPTGVTKVFRGSPTCILAFRSNRLREVDFCERRIVSPVRFLTSSAAHTYQLCRYDQWIHEWKENERCLQALQKPSNKDPAPVSTSLLHSPSQGIVSTPGLAPKRGSFYEQEPVLRMQTPSVKPKERKRGKKSMSAVADAETDATASEADIPRRSTTKTSRDRTSRPMITENSSVTMRPVLRAADDIPSIGSSARLRKPSQKYLEANQALRKGDEPMNVSSKSARSDTPSNQAFITLQLQSSPHLQADEISPINGERDQADTPSHWSPATISNHSQSSVEAPKLFTESLDKTTIVGSSTSCLPCEISTHSVADTATNSIVDKQDEERIPVSSPPETQPGSNENNENNETIQNLSSPPAPHVGLRSSTVRHSSSSPHQNMQKIDAQQDLSHSSGAHKLDVSRGKQNIGDFTCNPPLLPDTEAQNSAGDAHIRHRTPLKLLAAETAAPPTGSGIGTSSKLLSDDIEELAAMPRRTDRSEHSKAINDRRHRGPVNESSSSKPIPKFLKGRDATQYYRNFLMELVYLCGGVVPHSPSLLKRALKTKCIEANLESDIHIKLLKSQMNDLVKRGKVKIMHFAFQRNGFNHTKAIMALPHVQPTDGLFIEMQKRISSLPVEEDYIPPELDGEIARKASEITRKDSEIQPGSETIDTEILKQKKTRRKTRQRSASRTPPISQAPGSFNSVTQSLNTGFLTLKVPRIGQIQTSTNFTSHYFDLPAQSSLVFNTDANSASAETVPPLPVLRRRSGMRTARNTSYQPLQGQNYPRIPDRTSLPKSLRAILSQEEHRVSLQPAAIGENSVYDDFIQTIEVVAAWEQRNWNDLQEKEPLLWNFINHLMPRKNFTAVSFNDELEFRQVSYVASCNDPSLLLESDIPLPDGGSWDLFAAVLTRARTKQQQVKKPAGRRKRKFHEIDGRDDDSDFADFEGEVSDLKDERTRTRPTRKPKKRKVGTTDDKRRQTRVRHEPRGVGMRYLPKEAARRISLAFVVVKVLTGGLDKYLNFTLVNRLVSEETETLLRERWKVLSTRYNNDIDAYIQDMQVKYLDALADDKVPSVDYSNIDGTDWEGILEWAKANVTTESGDVLLEIPPTRDEFLALNKIEVVEPKPIRNLFNQSLNYTMSSKEEAWCSAVTGTPSKHSHMPNGGFIAPSFVVEEDELDLNLARARSWSLAAVLTPQNTFDVVKTQQKLLKLAKNEQACEVLLTTTMKKMQTDKIIVRQDSGEAVTTADGSFYSGTHGWKISARWFDKFENNRNINSRMLKSAAKYKLETIDPAFSEGNFIVLDKSPNIEDGAILAIFNLLHMGMLRVRPGADVPASRYGLDWEDQGYKTRCMDRDVLSFSTLLEATPRYTPGNPISAQHEARAVPKGGINQQDDMGLIPAWFDINHDFQVNIWEMILGGVIGVISVRPGISDVEIARTLGWALSLYDLNLVLHYLFDCNLIEHSCGGWDTTQWWWLVTGAATKDEQDARWRL